LRKDVAEAAGITDKTPFHERAKALRGKTIGIQGVGSIVHAWEAVGSLTAAVSTSRRTSAIAPMDPPGMLAALQTKALDGYATSLPYTTEAVIRGNAVMLASAVRDAPDLLPFAYGLVYTKPDTCTKAREEMRARGRARARPPPTVSSATSPARRSSS